MTMLTFSGFALLLAVLAAVLWTGRIGWRRTVIAFSLLAALSWVTYWQLGALREWRVHGWMATLEAGGELDAKERETFMSLLTELAGDHGRDPRYAYLLGHQLLGEEKFAQARTTFAALHTRGVDEEQVSIAYVQSDFLARDGVLGEATRALARSLADSDHPLLLEILVLDALSSNDREAFMRYWPAYSATPGGAALAGDFAQREIALPDAGPSIEVRVSVSPEIQADLDTPVFVLARRAGAPGPPLAVKRLRFADLPGEVRLSDSDAMLETNRLSDADRVEVVARIALSGGVIAAESDIEVGSGEIVLGEGAVQVNLQLQ